VDINIPGKSGYELLEIVRCHDYLNKAKIVVVTAGTLAEDVEKARHFGFDGFISKPLKTGEFARQIKNILNGITIWDWR
jgi:DNA-binding NarL/FixJ family response regulator